MSPPTHEERALQGPPSTNTTAADGTTHPPAPAFTFASAGAMVSWIRTAETTGLGEVVQLLFEDGIDVLEDGRVQLRWSGVWR